MPAQPSSWRVALAQMNATVGDLAGNSASMRATIARARDVGAHILAFPELALTGYPPEDLLLRTAFIEQAREALWELVDVAPEMVIVIGLPWVEDGVLYNAAAVLATEQLVAIVAKHHLPTYGVFDEDRYFAR